MKRNTKIKLTAMTAVLTLTCSGMTVCAADTYVTKTGDNLSKIAKNLYGDAEQWRAIYENNKDQIKDPNMIWANQTLVLPEGILLQQTQQENDAEAQAQAEAEAKAQAEAEAQAQAQAEAEAKAQAEAEAQAQAQAEAEAKAQAEAEAQAQAEAEAKAQAEAEAQAQAEAEAQQSASVGLEALSGQYDNGPDMRVLVSYDPAYKTCRAAVDNWTNGFTHFYAPLTQVSDLTFQAVDGSVTLTFEFSADGNSVNVSGSSRYEGVYFK